MMSHGDVVEMTKQVKYENTNRATVISHNSIRARAYYNTDAGGHATTRIGCYSGETYMALLIIHCDYMV